MAILKIVRTAVIVALMQAVIVVVFPEGGEEGRKLITYLCIKSIDVEVEMECIFRQKEDE